MTNDGIIINLEQITIQLKNLKKETEKARQKQYDLAKEKINITNKEIQILSATETLDQNIAEAIEKITQAKKNLRHAHNMMAFIKENQGEQT